MTTAKTRQYNVDLIACFTSFHYAKLVVIKVYFLNLGHEIIFNSGNAYVFNSTLMGFYK